MIKATLNNAKVIMSSIFAIQTVTLLTAPFQPVILYLMSPFPRQCPPWYYLTLPPNDTQTLVVNTTYPTNIFITKDDGSDLYR